MNPNQVSKNNLESEGCPQFIYTNLVRSQILNTSSSHQRLNILSVKFVKLDIYEWFDISPTVGDIICLTTIIKIDSDIILY